ncbi:MAG: GAF domain-containing protein [Deltaproteobacteria bacterium]|nr:MAG: GAF domain-containing protein [Deltaproteobacteria bacterium]
MAFKSSKKKRTLYYWLNIIFGLFTILPVAGFIYLGIKYGFLHDKFIKPFLLGVLLYSLVGFTVLRKIFDKITNISKEFSRKVVSDLPGTAFQDDNDEIGNIVVSFETIEAHYKEANKQLESKAQLLSLLKELAELCYITSDPNEILYFTLERALKMVDADVGSILILDDNESKKFIMRASTGHGDRVKIGDEIDFESSIAKYAVINKSPLVVEDIEKETRIGRSNSERYSTKSFMCVPLKSVQDILGVISISCKKSDKTFMKEDAEVLAPLLTIASFTYENLRYQVETAKSLQRYRSIERVFKILNSSFKGTELLHAIYMEVQSVVPFDIALAMQKEQNWPGHIKLADLFSNDALGISVGERFNYEGSTIDRVMKQNANLVIDNTSDLTNETDRKLLVELGYSACVLAPMTIDGQVSGLLVFACRNAEILHQNHDFVEWLGQVISFAIEQTNLSSAVLKRDKEMATIKQIGGALASSTFDIGSVLNYTMEMIKEIMDVEAGSLLLAEDDELYFATGFNVNPEVDMSSLGNFSLKFGQGIAGSVAARGESIIINDIDSASNFFGDVDSSTGFQTKSALCVPVISQGKVVGVIEVMNKIDGVFGPNDEDLLQSIASSVSIANENVRLYGETVAMAEHERDIRHMFQKFVPKEIVDQIVHEGDSTTSRVEELKTLTLINIDLRGFSKLAVNIGPQKTIAVLNHFFSVMGGIIFKHHGIVDKYLGDGFLALFGAPVSSTMDADNAISAALQMQASLPEINKYLGEELDAEIHIGISIHTGEVVVGNIGFEMKMDYTVIGDPVNTVFRLQDMTKPYIDGILLSENTRKAARSALDIKEIDEKYGGMKVYELLGRKKA